MPLPACGIVGRGASCAIRLSDPAVPMHWLELRWSDPGWRWRALAAEDRTRGAGALLEDGWRQLPESGASRKQRVRLHETVGIELVDGGPPQAFLADLQSGDTLLGDDTNLEVRDGLVLPFEVDGDRSRAVSDGDVLIRDGRAWRIHLAGVPAPTMQARIHLGREGASIELFHGNASAIVHQGNHQVLITGEHVRALAVYVSARAGGSPNDGWLSPQEAWDAWVASGGNPASPLLRLAWDRARCRNHLGRLGVTGLDCLFESRRISGEPHYRLGVLVG